MIKTLRKKILLGYGTALFLTVVVLIWAFINLLNLGRASDAILRENYKSILAAENMIDAIERQDSAILLLIVGYDNEGLKQFRENESLFLQWLSRAKDNITVSGEDRIVTTIDSGYTSYLVNCEKLRQLSLENPQKTGRLYHEVILPSFKSVRNTCVRLREINQKAMFQASERAQYVAEKAIWSMIIIGMVAIAVGLGFSLLLSKLLVKPLQQIMEATQKIAKGSYDVEISTDSSDELGRLAVEFNTMANKLKTYHDLNIEQIVAEKRKSESILRSIDDGIIVVDAEFKVTSINPTAAKILSIEPNESQGKHFLEIVRDEQLFNYVKQSAESGKPPQIEESKNVISIQQNETQHYYQFSITPVRTKNNAMLGVVLLLRDVTKLKELDRLKSDFVMTASHELRSPLTSITMSIDLLMEKTMDKISEKEQQLLTAAHEDLLRLKALVADLLDLSKIEAGKMKMDFDRVQVQKLCEKAVIILKTQAEAKSVDLSMKIPEDLPDVIADPNKIIWVLTNLISNAFRYTNTGGHIRISAEYIGPQIHISINDDGAGIPYEYQSKIFDKFMQAKSQKDFGGTGLGLAICKEIVRAHGGTIWVDSIPGEGSTFTFSLPVTE
ncbi:MAG: ATP-binding protein [Candidatus Marinimicrobia bacterium]|nr:ATP-binding protein [Candidatus Neomarinimicrobiota bacterium]